MNKNRIVIFLMCIIMLILSATFSFASTENVVNEVSLYNQLIETENVEEMYIILLENQTIILSELTLEEFELLKKHAEEIYLVNRRYYKRIYRFNRDD